MEHLSYEVKWYDVFSLIFQDIEDVCDIYNISLVCKTFLHCIRNEVTSIDSRQYVKMPATALKHYPRLQRVKILIDVTDAQELVNVDRARNLESFDSLEMITKKKLRQIYLHIPTIFGSVTENFIKENSQLDIFSITDKSKNYGHLYEGKFKSNTGSFVDTLNPNIKEIDLTDMNCVDDIGRLNPKYKVKMSLNQILSKNILNTTKQPLQIEIARSDMTWSWNDPKISYVRHVFTSELNLYARTDFNQFIGLLLFRFPKADYTHIKCDVTALKTKLLGMIQNYTQYLDENRETKWKDKDSMEIYTYRAETISTFRTEYKHLESIGKTIVISDVVFDKPIRHEFEVI